MHVRDDHSLSSILYDVRFLLFIVLTLRYCHMKGGLKPSGGLDFSLPNLSSFAVRSYVLAFIMIAYYSLLLLPVVGKHEEVYIIEHFSVAKVLT